MVREALTPEKLDRLLPADAAAMFITRRAEGLTAGEQQLLAEWLAKDEGNRRQFESAERAWQAFENAEGDEILAAMRIHALAPRAPARARWWPAVAAAAGVVLAIGLAWLLIPTASTFEYATARGEVREIQLPDGSELTLDGDSALMGRFGADARDIQLQRGRALFTVAPDKARPFAVTAAGRRVVAVGTRFDVNLLADGLSVTLLEGRVNVESVDSSTTPIALMPGQQFIERRGIIDIRTLEAAGEGATAWREGFIRFDDQPLSEAVAIMNRYSIAQIAIPDPKIGALRISGQFRAGESQRFAEALADVHGLRMVSQGERIELVRD